MQPKVSIIIPVYNTEAYLRECLDCAAGQTLREIEIICVDDGSTDSSPAILREYAAADDRFVVLTKKNGGQSSARNMAIEAARGEYVFFFDSDDRILPEMCEELYSAASADRLDNVYFNASVFFESTEVERDNQNYVDYYTRTGSYPGVMSGRELFTKMQNAHDYLPSPCLQFVRRGLLLDRDIRFREGIVHEDNLYTFVCICEAERVRYVDKAYFLRRVRDNSTMTAGVGPRHFDGYFTCLAQMLEYASGREFDQPTADAAASLIMSIFRNASTVYHRLPPDERGLVLKPQTVTERYLFNTVLANVAGGRASGNPATCRDCEVVNSLSYKLGRVLTFIPRKIYRGFLCVSDHGLVYTIKLGVKKLRRRA